MTAAPLHVHSVAAYESLLGQISALEVRIHRSLHGIEAEARGLGAIAHAAGYDDLAVRAEIGAADALSRSGNPSAAQIEELDLVERSAQRWPTLRRRAEMMLAVSKDRLGQRSDAMALMRSSLQDWPDQHEPAWRAEALMVFGLLAISRRGVDYSLSQHPVSEVHAHCGPLIVSVTLANFAEAAAECRDLAIATEFADDAIAVVNRHLEVTATLTLDSIARARCAVGELAAAEFTLNNALTLEEELGCTDVMGDPSLTLAEVKLAAGDSTAAWLLLEHPRRALRAHRTPWMRARDLRLRGAVLATLGRWQEAY